MRPIHRYHPQHHKTYGYKDIQEKPCQRRFRRTSGTLQETSVQFGRAQHALKHFSTLGEGREESLAGFGKP